MDGLTDMTKLIVAFRNFEKALNKKYNNVIFSDRIGNLRNCVESCCFKAARNGRRLTKYDIYIVTKFVSFSLIFHRI